jgi:hypothetical protein
MRQNSVFPVESTGTMGRAILALALIVALLYNPFFTVLNISRDLNVQHPVSYRATVASSELRRSAVEPAPLLIPALIAAVLATILPPYEVGQVQPVDFVSLPQASCDNIWFRPPPHTA